MFKGRKAYIATIHHKEKAIEPIFLSRLGLQVEALKNLNTDKFGTFVNYINKPKSQLKACFAKARAVLEHDPSIEIAIASQGSFGPHPLASHLKVNLEIITLIDRVNNIEVAGVYASKRIMSLETIIHSYDEFLKFIEATEFPKFGVIISEPILFGMKQKHYRHIKDFSQADAIAKNILKKKKFFSIKTDRRAMVNPYRMENVAHAASKLVDCIERVCPTCDFPAMKYSHTVFGQLCETCNEKSELPIKEIFICTKCHSEKEELYEEKAIDSRHCKHCRINEPWLSDGVVL